MTDNNDNHFKNDDLSYAQLVRAIMLDAPEELKDLLGTSKIDHYIDDTGRNPLHIAALHERHNSYHPLLQAGADPNHINSDGATPLDVAADQNAENYKKMIKTVKAVQSKQATIIPPKPQPRQKTRLARLFGDE